MEIVPLTLSHMLCHTDLVKLLFAMYWVNHPSADPGECKSKWLKKHAAISIGHFTVTRPAAWEILISNILNKQNAITVSVRPLGYALSVRGLKIAPVAAT